MSAEEDALAVARIERQRARLAAWRAANKDRVKQYRRNYKLSPEQRARRRDLDRERQRRHRDLRSARRKAWYAALSDEEREAYLAKRREWHQKNRERTRLHRAANRERQRAYCRKWAAKNVERERARGRAKHQANRAERLKQNREYRMENKEQLRAKRRKQYEQVMATTPEIFREKARIWRQKNPGQIRVYILRRYGLTVAAYDQLLHEQNGGCAICHSTESGYKKKPGVFFVDHDHETGAVRGLLCSLCNLTLGQFKDDPQRFRAAADYLEHHQRRTKSKVA